MIRYLGVDWGEKRIGLALGDSETGIATPYKTVESLEDVMKVIKQEDIDMVIAGNPLSITDVKHPTSEKFNEFINNLKKQIRIPIKLADERLSSKAADNLAGGKKVKASRDELAAMVILQSYIDGYNSNTTN